MNKLINIIFPKGSKIRQFVKTKVMQIKINKKFKIGVAYNLFDGIELLEQSIKSIKSCVDYICVIYQTISNSGQSGNVNDLEMLASMKANKLIDDFYIYNPEKVLNATENERRKRIFGLKMVKKHKCTHFLSMDIDEFYKKEEFLKALKFIKLNNIQSSAVSIIEYLGKPEYQLLCNYMYSPINSEYYTFYVPFITKISSSKRKMLTSYFPLTCDSTRIFNGRSKFYLFPKHEIAMHHMSHIRKDLEKKYLNSSISLAGSNTEFNRMMSIKDKILNFNFNKKNIPINYSFIDNFPVKKVDNYFNIKI